MKRLRIFARTALEHGDGHLTSEEWNPPGNIATWIGIVLATKSGRACQHSHAQHVQHVQVIRCEEPGLSRLIHLPAVDHWFNKRRGNFGRSLTFLGLSASWGTRAIARRQESIRLSSLLFLLPTPQRSCRATIFLRDILAKFAPSQFLECDCLNFWWKLFSHLGILSSYGAELGQSIFREVRRHEIGWRIEVLFPSLEPSHLKRNFVVNHG